MPTEKLNLPTIADNQINDVVTDMNNLANAIDSKVDQPNGIAGLDANGKLHTDQIEIDTSWVATKGDVAVVSTNLTNHTNDYVKHPATATTTSTGNAYSVTLTPAPSGYVANLGIVMTANSNSTGSTTLNVNNLGVKPILKSNGNAVNNIKANGVYTLRYNPDAIGGAGAFILQGEGGSGNAQPSDILSGKTASTDQGDIVGTMPNRGAVTITPGTTNKTIQNGFHNGSGYVVGDADLIASNIKKGVNIFGVSGEYSGDGLSISATTSFSQKKITSVDSDGNYYGLSYNSVLVTWLAEKYDKNMNLIQSAPVGQSSGCIGSSKYGYVVGGSRYDSVKVYNWSGSLIAEVSSQFLAGAYRVEYDGSKLISMTSSYLSFLSMDGTLLNSQSFGGRYTFLLNKKNNIVIIDDDTPAFITKVNGQDYSTITLQDVGYAFFAFDYTNW